MRYGPGGPILTFGVPCLHSMHLGLNHHTKALSSHLCVFDPPWRSEEFREYLSSCKYIFFQANSAVSEEAEGSFRPVTCGNPSTTVVLSVGF